MKAQFGQEIGPYIRRGGIDVHRLKNGAVLPEEIRGCLKTIDYQPWIGRVEVMPDPVIAWRALQAVIGVAKTPTPAFIASGFVAQFMDVPKKIALDSEHHLGDTLFTLSKQQGHQTVVATAQKAIRLENGDAYRVANATPERITIESLEQVVQARLEALGVANNSPTNLI